MSEQLENVLRQLRAVKANGSGFVACCPAHDDHNPSLSVREENGKILMHCHAGCAFESVIAAIGLEAAELFADNGSEGTRTGHGGVPVIVAKYAYVDEDEDLLYEVVRYSDKSFKQRKRNDNGGWTWSLNGVRRILYRLPKILKAPSILITEGEKDVGTAEKWGFAATTNSGGAGKWQAEFSEFLRGKRIVIIADSDPPGRKHAQQIAASLHGKVPSLKVLEMPRSKDLTEWVDRGGTKDGLLKLINDTPEWVEQAPAPRELYLRAVSVTELLKLDLKPREMLLQPFLPTQGLAMLYSKRGVGKTFISLGISAAVACGSKFLKWTAPKPRKVLYVDGEMPGSALRQRLADIIAGMNLDAAQAELLHKENLRIITPDLQSRGLPDLATISGQDEIEQHLEGKELLVLDKLSSLVRAVKENEGEGWLPVQDWALDLRRRGISVLFVHHAGKAGAQRGTSRREDLLDSVITLKHPNDYSPSEGLRCDVHYEKSRGFFGEDARPFEVKLMAGPSGEALWTVADPETSLQARVLELHRMSMSVRDIAEELATSKSTVQRIVSGSVPLSQR